MAGTLQKNPIYKNFLSDAKNNIADGAGVTPYDTRFIVAQNAPGGLPATLTSGLQHAATRILSDATAGVVGNAILEFSPNDFAPMTVTSIVVAAAVGNNPPIATVTTTPLFGQVWQLGAQVALRGCTSAIGILMNYNTYRTIEVLTGSTTGFTAYAPTIPAGTGIESSSGDPASHLGSSSGFAILGASAVTGSAGAGSVVGGGNIGIAPNKASSVTNFPPSTLTAPGVFHYDDAVAIQAQVDLAAAIVYYQGLTPTLSGLSNLATSGNGANVHTYLPGNYFSAGASSLDIPNTFGGITLDAQGNANAVFVLVAGSTITLESGSSITLANGAKAENVYWINGSSFTASGASDTMVGNILAHTSITLNGGTLNGRALANVGAVTLATTENINAPAYAPAVASGAQALLKYQGRLAGTSLCEGN